MRRVILAGVSLALAAAWLGGRATAQVPAPSPGHCVGGGQRVSGICPNNGRPVTVYIPDPCNGAETNAIMARACGIGAYNPVPGLERRLSSLDGQAASLQRQADALQQRDNNLQSRVDALRSQIRGMQDRISGLQGTNANRRGELRALRRSEALGQLRALNGSGSKLDAFDTAPGNPLDLRPIVTSPAATAGRRPGTRARRALRRRRTALARARRPRRPAARHSAARRVHHPAARRRKRSAAAARQRPSPGAPWAYKGWEALQAHDWKLAAAWYQQALAHDPGNKALAGMARYSQYAAAHAPNPISRQNGGAGVYKPGTPPPSAEMLRMMDQWARSNPGLIPPGHSQTIPATTRQAAQSQ